MTDHVSLNGRSKIMRAIKGKNTKPELYVRSLLHREGYRFRIHRKDLPGTPDIVFFSRKKAIFINGCFWHQHEDPLCPISQKPSSNKEYWEPKLKRNKERDKIAHDKLKKLGWEIFVVWECSLKDEKTLRESLLKFIGSTKYVARP
jgi:DNA mismatch endonuclease (patch repair protein)